MATQEAIQAAIAEKMKSMGIQDPEEFVKSLPVPVQRRVEYLKGLHEKYEELHEQFQKEKRYVTCRGRKQPGLGAASSRVHPLPATHVNSACCRYSVVFK